MEKKLVFTETKAKKLYPTASKEIKSIFEMTFGKLCFKNVDTIKSFQDVLDILNETENSLPHQKAKTIEELSDNATWRLRRICKVYNESTGKTVDRNNTKQVRYFPYSYLSGGPRVLYVNSWYYFVYFPAGLDFLELSHAKKAIVIFKDIFNDYFGVK